MQPLGQSDASLGRTVVVLAGGNVSCCAGEVQVRAASFLLLSTLPRQAGKVAADVAPAVVTHWMCGIVVAGGDFIRATIKGHGLEQRVDQSFGQRDERRIFTR